MQNHINAKQAKKGCPTAFNYPRKTTIGRPNNNKVRRKEQMNNQVEIIMPGDDVDIIEIIQGKVIFGFNK